MKFYSNITLIALLIFFNASVVYAGDKEKIIDLFEKSMKFYEKNSQFKMLTKYRLFSGEKSTDVDESYDGILLRKNNNYYSKIGQTEFINQERKSIKIDNESKLIKISEKQMSATDKVYDLKQFYGNFEKFELTSNGQEWICTLTAPLISFVPYSKVIIHLDKSNFAIKKQVLFLMQKVKYKNSKGKVISDFPRIEISFLDFKIETIDDSFFNLNNYVETKKGKSLPSKKYATYKIVD